MHAPGAPTWFVSCTHLLYVCTSSCNFNCNGRRQLVALVFLAVMLVILGRQCALESRVCTAVARPKELLMCCWLACACDLGCVNGILRKLQHNLGTCPESRTLPLYLDTSPLSSSHAYHIHLHVLSHPYTHACGRGTTSTYGQCNLHTEREGARERADRCLPYKLPAAGVPLGTCALVSRRRPRASYALARSERVGEVTGPAP